MFVYAVRFAFLSFSLLLSCGPTNNTDSDLKGAFDNSTRRLAGLAERAALVKLTPRNSAGFFLRNQKNKMLVATARHTLLSANKDAKLWCKTGAFLAELGSDERGNVLKDIVTAKLQCLSVVLDDKRSDLIIFSAEKNPLFDPTTLRLASFNVTAGMPLALMGYPKDSQWLGRSAVVSENCWVSETALDPRVRMLSVPVFGTPFGHNCTVYSGNSGGPIVLEGSDAVVGMPVSFEPPPGASKIEDYKGAVIPRAQKHASAENLFYIKSFISDVIAENKAVLSSGGELSAIDRAALEEATSDLQSIMFVDRDNDLQILDLTKFRNRRSYLYVFGPQMSCVLHMHPIYGAEKVLKKMYVTYRPYPDLACRGGEYFSCSAGVCTADVKGPKEFSRKQISNFNADSVVIKANGLSEVLRAIPQ